MRQCRASQGGGGLLFHGQTHVVLQGQHNEERSNHTRHIRGSTHHMSNGCVTHLKVFRANNSVAVVCFGRHVIIEFAGVPEADSQRTDSTSHTKSGTFGGHVTRLLQRDAPHKQHRVTRAISPPISQQRSAATRAATLAAPIHASCLFSNDCFMLSKCSGSPAAK